MEKFHLSGKGNSFALLGQLGNQSANDYQKKITAIWGKVELLKEVNYITTEAEKYAVAYRFMEIELEKVCHERELLKNSLIDMVQAYTR